MICKYYDGNDMCNLPVYCRCAYQTDNRYCNAIDGVVERVTYYDKCNKNGLCKVGDDMIPVPTKEEVDKRYDERGEGDIIGFETDEYLIYMSFDKLRTIVKPEMSDDDLREAMSELSRDHMLDTMREYMAFAWEKANNMRGISANRSIEHYVAWTWLAGDAGLSAEIGDMAWNEYCYYGKPILERICNFYGWDYGLWDDGVRTNG